ncbi:PLP-dependent aminotransferase family protein [Microbacterium sp. 18062]|uniref:MocR-like pyridoxine biosynthesis transcription factor PdxR n=1 Tax=Microbacterium sp. 18062 TaxID=2681410 RepID=UPI001359C56F|nr:PLP-dependent aminotransferase family protein [Microbacterium sp. 18062]
MDQSKPATVTARIRELIHTGTLREGDPLPSTRALAVELGVARGTVVAAYEQLDGEGYIRTRHGAVARVVAAAAAPVRTPPARDRGHPPAPRVLIDATPGIPAVTTISPRDWRAAWRAAADLPLRNETSDAEGSRSLREQLAAQLALSRGFAPGPERILVTAGTSEGLSLVTEALRTRAGRAPRIAVEDPGYRGGRRAMTSSGGELVPVPVGPEGLDLTALREGAEVDAVVVTPTHQYPLGVVMPVARRRELLVWAARAGVVVVEDDYDSEFRHRGSPMPALAALDAEGVVVHLGGFSKILDPRLRCAYAVLPAASGARPGIAAAIIEARRARGPVVAEPAQEALAHLLRTGALRRHLGRVRRDYAHKRERIATRLAAVPGIRVAALSGGLHVVVTWPAAPAGVPAAVSAGIPAAVLGSPTAADVVALLAERGIRVAELSRYAVDPHRAATLNGVVLGYGAPSPAELDRVLDALLEQLGGAAR